MTWTTERVARLHKLWADPVMTASKIAKQLGGVTRNAVIGKAHRENLPPKAPLRGPMPRDRTNFIAGPAPKKRQPTHPERRNLSTIKAGRGRS